MNNIQVQPNHYADLTYDNKKRFISYWHQIKEIIDTNLGHLLEIGIGNGFVTNYLKTYGLDVTTIDIDKRLNPDKIGSVLDLPFQDNEFELITCFEVLEHLPFSEVPQALRELRRVASKKVIISIPDRTITYKLLVKLPIIKEHSFMVSLPSFLAAIHTFDGQHYWEMGKKGYSEKKFKNLLQTENFTIHKSYRIFEVPSHHFFILSV